LNVVNMPLAMGHTTPRRGWADPEPAELTP